MTVISDICLGSFGVEDIERAMRASLGAPGDSADKALGQLRASAAEGDLFPVVTQEKLPGTMGWMLAGKVLSIEDPARAPGPAPAVVCPCCSCSYWATNTWRAISQPGATIPPCLIGHGGAQCPGTGLGLPQTLHCDSNIRHKNENTKFRFKVDFALLMAASNLKISHRI